MQRATKLVDGMHVCIEWDLKPEDGYFEHYDFVVKKIKNGYKYYLVADNGHVLGESNVYKTKATCIKGIEKAKECIELAKHKSWFRSKDESNPKFELKIKKRGNNPGIYYGLNASNGRKLFKGYCVNWWIVHVEKSIIEGCDKADIKE